MTIDYLPDPCEVKTAARLLHMDEQDDADVVAFYHKWGCIEKDILWREVESAYKAHVPPSHIIEICHFS